jgi:hypothetical protein
MFGCMGLGGCLSVIVGVLVVGGLIAGIFYLVMGSIKSSPVYLEAMKAAQADPRVTQALGTPIQSGLLVTGSIEQQGISGDANLVIPISGPRGSGTLYAAAREGNGVWQFYTLAVQVNGQTEVIPLR